MPTDGESSALREPLDVGVDTQNTQRVLEALDAFGLPAHASTDPIVLSTETTRSEAPFQEVGGLRASIRERLKRRIVRIAEANTERRDNLDEVLGRLLPLITPLAVDFALKRPRNELELTRQPWKNIWDNAQDIEPDLGTVQDRSNIYQVVENDFYYNVTNLVVEGASVPNNLQYFLKGEFEIARPASPANRGAFGLNVIDLEFTASVARPGFLPDNRRLRELVSEVDAFVVAGNGVGERPFPIPGPLGSTGLLFNLYVDDELRIATGLSEAEDGGPPGIFVLRRSPFARDLPPFR